MFRLSVGTKSLLFGAHQLILHPIIVFYCWCKLYGFPIDPRIWICILVHDCGYFGMPNMDGKEGKTHPYFGACLVSKLFEYSNDWYLFTLLHSRTMHNCYPNLHVSKLCYADKMAIKYTPRWMYRKDELDEYISNSPMTCYSDWKKYLCHKVDVFLLSKDEGYGPADYQTRR